jgi:hypothetical protein
LRARAETSRELVRPLAWAGLVPDSAGAWAFARQVRLTAAAMVDVAERHGLDPIEVVDDPERVPGVMLSCAAAHDDDYLAWALLDTPEATGDASWSPRRAASCRPRRSRTFRTVPMLRWRHGAWEPLDDRLSLLASYGLAVDVRRGENLGGRRDVYLLEEGRQVVVRLLGEVSELCWYEDRARLVRIVAGIRPKALERLARLQRAA